MHISAKLTLLLITLLTSIHTSTRREVYAYYNVRLMLDADPLSRRRERTFALRESSLWRSRHPVNYCRGGAGVGSFRMGSVFSRWCSSLSCGRSQRHSGYELGRLDCDSSDTYSANGDSKLDTVMQDVLVACRAGVKLRGFDLSYQL